MKVSELEGALLDYWVAKAEGKDVCPRSHNSSFLHPEYCFTHKKGICESYSTEWAVGGPILELNRIETHYNPTAKTWVARLSEGNRGFKGNKFTDGALLIAAMRCYVVSKFGDEVPDVPYA